MASVEQAKDALEAEREHAAEMTERALSAINSMIAFNSMTLTILAIVIGLIGIFGAVALVSFARTHARKIAHSRLDAYIKSSEGRDFIRGAITEEVDARIHAKITVMVQPSEHLQQEPSFPPPPSIQPGGSS